MTTPTKRLSRANSIARAFHEEYEGLASYYNYETRPESAVPWSQVPAANKQLMVETVENLMRRGMLS